MSEPYTIIDAIREEIDTLKELETVYEKEEKFLLLSDYQRQRRSLERILNRFEKGYEYYMGINNEGNAQLKYRQTDKHLLREYPALREAKENYDIVKEIVK